MHLRYAMLIALMAGCFDIDDKSNPTLSSNLDSDCTTPDCDDDPWNDNTDPVDVTFTDDVWPIFEARCAECHDSIANPPRLASPEDADQLVNQPASVSDKVYVIPTDAGNSYLWQKLTGQHLVSGGSGGMMPAEGDELSHVEKQFVSDWIDGGALP